MKALLALLLSVACTNAHAIGTYSFVPSTPTSNDPISIRIDVVDCLLPLNGIVTVFPDEPAIEVRYFGDDTDCDPSVPANTQTPRFQAIGTLPAGHYATRVYTCGFGPQGTTCDVVSSGSLVVQGAVTGALSTIPTLSGTGAIALIFAVMLVGVLITHRRL
jgi:hypothetical protein